MNSMCESGCMPSGPAGDQGSRARPPLHLASQSRVRERPLVSVWESLSLPAAPGRPSPSPPRPVPGGPGVHTPRVNTERRHTPPPHSNCQAVGPQFSSPAFLSGQLTWQVNPAIKATFQTRRSGGVAEATEPGVPLSCEYRFPPSPSLLLMLTSAGGVCE